MKTRLRITIVLSLSVLFSPFIHWSAAFGQNENPSVTPDGWHRNWLVLAPTGNSGRIPFPTDGVAHAMARGTLRELKAEQKVESATGDAVAWTSATADDDGWLRSPALRGGHAALSVHVANAQTVVLEASGHSMVYCNGEPRVGDPYRTGYVRLPVRLRAGTNELIFRVSRGQVRARVVDPQAELQLNIDDVSLPDGAVGEQGELHGSVVVINTRDESASDLWIETQLGDAQPSRSTLQAVERLTIRKVPFRISVSPDLPAGEIPLHIRLFRGAPNASRLQNVAEIPFRVRASGDVLRRTFVSGIDGSVQYYALRRATDPDAEALFLTLHGASVEAVRQAAAYESKTWGHVVAPTNRRPFGFDWEDWGRQDALEVLELARASLKPADEQIYLTGHSMGGHGAWHLAVTYPNMFAAVGPSAGWISFRSYAGKKEEPNPDEITQLLERATSPSDTLSLSSNLQKLGVYVLHGTDDDNVPVTEARRMREVLAEFHPDFAYHEQPDAGHWWGNQCVDWPEMFSFFKTRQRRPSCDVRSIQFKTASPGVSASADWVTVEMQDEPFQLSHVDLSLDVPARRFSGTTTNVNRLSINLDTLSAKPSSEKLARLKPGDPIKIDLDNQPSFESPWPPGGQLHLRKSEGGWASAAPAPLEWKGPHRYGPFKEAFRNRVVLVYGTVGTEAENDWAYAKARYDAEQFWYRGNGAIEVIPDIHYNRDTYASRNVVLYGNADTNAAWSSLIKASPIDVRRGEVQLGEHTWTGDDLSALFVRPMEHDTKSLVAAVAGTGHVGMRATNSLPYFTSGVAYPDVNVFRANVLKAGAQGVVATGFFGQEWKLAGGTFAERIANN